MAGYPETQKSVLLAFVVARKAEIGHVLSESTDGVILPMVIKSADHAAIPASTSGEKLETLNFKVPANFKKAFKGYAVAQGITMVELLRKGFELSKAEPDR